MLLEVNMQGSRGSRGFGVIALGRAVRERAASIESPAAVGELAGGECDGTVKLKLEIHC
jgi:hypothetical protein